jgi:hypothetical protein
LGADRLRHLGNHFRPQLAHAVGRHGDSVNREQRRSGLEIALDAAGEPTNVAQILAMPLSDLDVGHRAVRRVGVFLIY